MPVVLAQQDGGCAARVSDLTSNIRQMFTLLDDVVGYRLWRYMEIAHSTHLRLSERRPPSMVNGSFGPVAPTRSATAASISVTVDPSSNNANVDNVAVAPRITTGIIFNSVDDERWRADVTTAFALSSLRAVKSSALRQLFYLSAEAGGGASTTVNSAGT
ncbi:hypothetical protein EVAR_90408_1 [Eumeta japonica]|uniref:Uncharacterized protein n=1 Tax=Eumeta variegata TaxID=151549 RepID=A0A4C1YBS8_EUMVA|nr:hypothetical protein EVAR_90408_1 [Eumeta japonica]